MEPLAVGVVLVQLTTPKTTLEEEVEAAVVLQQELVVMAPTAACTAVVEVAAGLEQRSLALVETVRKEL